jgi:quinoprotein glucose dehydrogenase
MRCHRAGQDHTTGGETAPNLLGIANRHSDRRYFLESIIQPNAVIAPGFSTISLDFKNGASITGKLLASTPEHFDLESEDKTIRVRRSDVASHTTPVSSMPPMGDLLTPAEIRDLIAWLATLTENPKSLPASSPPSDPPILDPATLPVPETSTQSGIDPAVLKTGKTQYIVCAACHGQQGEGTAAGPPLAGSEWVNGPPENLIRIQLRGLQGPITVKGQTYDFPSGMAPLAYQTDEQIAAVLTYIRSSFGNSAPAVTPAEVAALRPEAGKPMLTAAELIPPTPEASPAPAKYADLRPASSISRTLVTSLAALLIFTLLAFATRVFLHRKP